MLTKAAAPAVSPAAPAPAAIDAESCGCRLLYVHAKLPPPPPKPGTSPGDDGFPDVRPGVGPTSDTGRVSCGL
ncbi:MAG TPA: hypothetical protein VFA67_04780 [Candidatus Sulfotelmatobacter sp.]|nr:hypothetical protein [Candidatus Sulfotelmatobacter sp.]